VHLETVLRLAGAIVLETLALGVWNVGTRAPGTLLRDVVRSARRPGAIAMGAVSGFVGLVLVATATVVLIPVVAGLTGYFVPLAIYTFVTALALEFLVGGDLRAALGRLGAEADR
jgi:hypothetical protein